MGRETKLSIDPPASVLVRVKPGHQVHMDHGKLKYGGGALLRMPRSLAQQLADAGKVEAV